MVSKGRNKILVYIATQIDRWQRGLLPSFSRHHSIVQTSRGNNVDTGRHTNVVQHGAGNVIIIDSITFYDVRKAHERFRRRRCGIDIYSLQPKQLKSVLHCIHAYTHALNQTLRDIDNANRSARIGTYEPPSTINV